MNSISPWLLNVNALLNNPGLIPFKTEERGGYTFNLINLEDALWLVASWPKGSRIAFRLAYSPNDHLTIKKMMEHDQQLTMLVSSMLGDYELVVDLPEVPPGRRWAVECLPAAGENRQGKAAGIYGESK